MGCPQMEREMEDSPWRGMSGESEAVTQSGTMGEDKFSGPLFIVGMPRSGTKLLRDLLNRHPRIGIPAAESQFIPHFVAQFGLDPQVAASRDDFGELLHAALGQTVYYQNMRRLAGREITSEYLQANADFHSWESIIESIFRYYAPPDRDSDFIWGDKTPPYMMHMPLLKRIFPSARFVHIVRDFRDCGLSISKAWGHSIIRAAEKWRRCLTSACEDGARIGDDYMEVRYRDLLLEPEHTLQRICTFVDCDFISGMLSLEKSCEGVGDAKGYTVIKSDNLDKYKTRLEKSRVKRLEEICYPVAEQLGFPCHFATQFRPLHPVLFFLLGVRDKLASIAIYTKRKGIRKGMRYLVAGYLRGSWRYANIKRERQADHNSET